MRRLFLAVLAAVLASGGGVRAAGAGAEPVPIMAAATVPR